MNENRTKQRSANTKWRLSGGDSIGGGARVSRIGGN